MCFINCHNHTDYSNLRLLDCTNSVEDLIKTSNELGYKGIAISDHESVSAHIQAIKKTRELKEKNVIQQDFKLILGNEIYLVDDVEYIKNNYVSGVTKFPHFLLIAKDKEGHKQLRYLSSMAWKNSFYTGAMERVPTDKKILEEVVKSNPNHLIASTACLGSETSIHLLSIRDAEQTNDLATANEHRDKLNKFINWCIDLFGKNNFFIELQPAYSEEQIFVNKELVKIAEIHELKTIITTDTHYLRPDDKKVHKAFLNAKDGDREIDSFYEATFLQTVDEIYERMNYFDKNIVAEALNNTLYLGEMIEDYTIEHETIIPKISLPKFEVIHMFKPAYQQYEYIEKMANSDNEQDRYIIKLIEEGFNEKVPRNTLSKEKFHIILNRINIELGEIWEISQKLNQAMSAYYITVREIINIIWDDDCGNSLVGSGRGSSSGFYICFLLGITQIDPLAYGTEMPHWRHLHRSRPDVGALDIDIDTEGSKRPRIIQALKKHFGDERLLQVCTFGTEGSKSALQTAARGLGIDSDISLHLSSLIPFERGQNWSLSDCLYGDKEKNRKPVKEFINGIDKYEGLKETALKLEGKINKRSIHAGGVILFNEEYYHSNALMKAPNGLPITQFNLDDCQAVGNVKFDLLTIEALDKIRVELDMLLEYKEIEWQGSLRKTFDKYLHPNNLNMDNPKLYEMLGEGTVTDLFQFSTEIGYQAAIKVKPSNLLEVAAANSLMRLVSDGEEQPIDVFIKHKGNIQLWYKEMSQYGLTSEEIKVLEKHLLKLYGVADTQESVMLLAMDEKIAGFSVQQANKLRKAIAKRSEKDLIEVKELFFEQGRKKEISNNLLSYVWDVQIKRQLGYAFSILHTIPYSIIALQELNLNYQFNSLYWNTACLTVNSRSTDGNDDEEINSDEEETDTKKKSTNYGKVALAIGQMHKRGIEIALPDINNAGFGFKPDLRNNQIIFGLKGINGIGDDIVHIIIKNRPYSSFDDFINKLFKTKQIKKGQIVKLIKAGCFDKFEDRFNIMKQFINKIYEPKQKLTMQNFNGLIENDLIPECYALLVRLYRFRKYISQNVYKTISKPKDKWLLLDDISTNFYNQHFSDQSIVEVNDGKIAVSELKFKKEYDKKMEPFKSWLQNEETLETLNKKLFSQQWYKYAEGTISKWEMDSLSFYYHKHELSHVNADKYGIIDFEKLPKEPKEVGSYKSRGLERPKFEIVRIAGTVLDKDKSKHTVTVLTTTGVVTVKFYDGVFAHYNKQISRTNDGDKEILEKSWFTRGNKLLIAGYRRDSNFRPHKYTDSVYRHTVSLIENIGENGDITLKTEREGYIN
ncbi:PHP domain-containing protein [Brevibacillus laterosporus]|uniref:DNA-directed DNA polymerase n=1 Tax=Brevibacillus laterosporus TaxID=1465 RepID=A0AAP8QHB3_BRELA|nr:PHP domain-containing protein [Brevibacillus laterosporus]PPB12935.1 DNA polymerase III subunit alpha [Brevibacillus laterosporus]